MVAIDLVAEVAHSLGECVEVQPADGGWSVHVGAWSVRGATLREAALAMLVLLGEVLA